MNGVYKSGKALKSNKVAMDNASNAIAKPRDVMMLIIFIIL